MESVAATADNILSLVIVALTVNNASGLVKLLRFFLFNPQRIFSVDDITRRARLVRRTARTELNALERAGVIMRKSTYEVVDERAGAFSLTVQPAAMAGAIFQAACSSG